MALTTKIATFAGTVLIAGSSIVTGATTEVKTWFTDTGPALIRSAFKPGSFTVSPPSAVCVGEVPQVKLVWTTSSGANVYLVERQYPSGGSFEDVGESSTTSFTDATYEPGYDRGSFSYRVQAQGKSGDVYAPVVKVVAPECVTTSVTTTSSAQKKLTTTTPKPTTTTTKPATTTKPTTTTKPATTSSGPILTVPTTPLPVPNIPIPTLPTTATTMKWGTYVDGGAAGLKAFESLVGQSVDIQAVFAGWGGKEDFPSYLAPSLKGTGKTLLIFWEPSNGDAGQVTGNSENVNQTAYNYDSIISGKWDTYIRSFALQAKAYGDPVILAPFNEMNGDWYPWAGTLNGNTPAKAIAAWRRMHGLFADVPNVQWGWAPNSTSWPNTAANDLTAYYPGDAYVDYVGADGFNFNDDAWDTFGALFDAALVKLETYNKPIILFSMASAQGTKKAEWITDAFKVQIPKHPKIVGWVWFNTNKEKDWRVNSDSASLSAFKAIIP